MTHMYFLADAYFHRLDPFVIEFREGFGIRWYGVAYAAGFLVAWLLARAWARRGLVPLSPQQIGDFMITAILGVLLGGRVGWVLFYSPQALWTFDSQIPYWEVLAIHRGGMASHGGVIGVTVAMVWYGRRHGVSALQLLDFGVLVTPIGLMFGRIANFINSELRGVVCADDFPLAVKFPKEIIEEWGVDQLRQVTEAARYLDSSRAAWAAPLDMASDFRAQGMELPDSLIHTLEGMRLSVYSAVMNGNQYVIEVVAPVLPSRHPSQLYQAAAEGLVLGGLLWLIWLIWKPKHAGVLGSLFLVIYGILRIVTEIWRLPDEGVERIMGLSRGQLLSTFMIVFGLALVFWLVRRPLPPSEQEQEEPAQPKS
ncbi:MAG: prolipoprotein diacylglyceryl transferase [Planctomycetes bacterium]|nr:prolipoprotein diacylglyceryl transferase [Planctomycetota bacterium]NOG52992.1 prolipoprotein diacylglyceryl transferase [Planctomycetota bacterium]